MSKEMIAKTHSAGREFFLYGLAFVTLYVMAISLGGLVFQLINIYFPDAASPDNYYRFQGARDLMRGFASALIVAVPLLYWLIFKLRQERRRDEHMARSALRKWLTYITLLVASMVALGDVIGIVNGFLGGELATRAFLKMITVLVIAVSIIIYFSVDVNENRK